MNQSLPQRSITRYFAEKIKDSECSEDVKPVQRPKKESANKPHFKEEQVDVIASPSTSGIASKSET